MVDAYMQALLDSPIDTAVRANKIFLPEGRKSAPRVAKIKSDPAPGDLKPSEVRKRRQDEASAKLVAVLDYYATTSVPFDRIAIHTKLTEEQVVESMARRGRTS